MISRSGHQGHYVPPPESESHAEVRNRNMGEPLSWFGACCWALSLACFAFLAMAAAGMFGK